MQSTNPYCPVSAARDLLCNRSIAESCSYEVGMLVVGLTGSLQQSIYTVLFNYSFLLFMVTYALRLAASIRVGNELGAGGCFVAMG